MATDRIGNPNVKERTEVVHYKRHGSPLRRIAKQGDLKAPIAQLGLGHPLATAFGPLIAVVVRSGDKCIARKKILTLELQGHTFRVHATTRGRWARRRSHLEHVCPKKRGRNRKSTFFKRSDALLVKDNPPHIESKLIALLLNEGNQELLNNTANL
jgi:hypothetical protein